MFPMQNFEPESAVISASSNSALIEKYLRNTCLGQGAVPTFFGDSLQGKECVCVCVCVCVFIYVYVGGIL